MRKINIALLLTAFIGCTALAFAQSNDFNTSAKSAGVNEGDGGAGAGIVEGVDLSKSEFAGEYKNRGKQENIATLRGVAYVGVDDSLTVRNGPGGAATGVSLVNNEEVYIESAANEEWYHITKPTDGYVHALYVFKTKNQKNTRDDYVSPYHMVGNQQIKVAGKSSQARLVYAADQLTKQFEAEGSFPYDPATNGGSLGCAQVVSTALVAAGVLPSTSLSCLEVKSWLQDAGWELVSTPPFMAGDVVFWATYDTSGDNVNDPDTHIGIIMETGDSVRAVSNSSDLKKPRYHMADYGGQYPVSSVLRKL